MELPEGVKVTVGGRTFKGEITGKVDPALAKVIKGVIDRFNGKTEKDIPIQKKSEPKQVDKP